MADANKALRYNSNKLRLDLVPTSLTRYVGAALTYGAEKYAPNNWRKGFDYSSIIASLKRHLADFEEGKDFDEESGLPSLALLGCNTAFLIEHWDKKLGTDDRVQGLTRQPLVYNQPPRKEE